MTSTDAPATVLESNTTVTVRFEDEGHRIVLGPGPAEVTVIDRERCRSADRSD